MYAGEFADAWADVAHARGAVRVTRAQSSVGARVADRLLVGLAIDEGRR